MKNLVKQSKIPMKSVFCITFLIVGICTMSSLRVSAISDSYDKPQSPSLTQYNPFSVLNDDDLIGFPGTGTEGDPYIIEYFSIETSESNGIYITGTTKYFVIQKCFIDAADYGIFVDDVVSGTATVHNNTCRKNSEAGIYIRYSENSTVSNNICNSNGFSGISIKDSYYTTVTNNECNYNDEYGIAIKDSGLNTVTNNKCSDIIHYLGRGIWVYKSYNVTVTNNECNNNFDGIMIHGSEYSIVTNNTCMINHIGIDIPAGADYCIVSYNLLQENDGPGVHIISNYSNIHHNTFVANEYPPKTQALDNGGSNNWYETSTNKGNFWSDWSGTGAYSIDGVANAVDPYPLADPVVDYTLGSDPEESQFNPIYTILLPALTLLVIRIFSRKRCKVD